MSYTETQTKSWFSRFTSSLIGMLIGFVFFVGATILLWMNEGDFVYTKNALLEAQSICVEHPNIAAIDPAYNGKLIHASAMATTKEELIDPLFLLGGVGIAFFREVEYFQWKENESTETRTKIGGGEETITTYSYSTEWVPEPIETQNFHDPNARLHYINTPLLSLKDLELYAKNVKFGAYTLPDFLIYDISGKQPLPCELTQKKRDKLIKSIFRGRTDLLPLGMINVDRIPVSKLPQVLHEEGNTLYIGASPISPKVGDVRIQFFLLPPSQISIIAQVSNNSFTKYHAPNNVEVVALAMGTKDKEEMFAEKHSDNLISVWSFRVLGAILIIFGVKLIFTPLSVFVSVLPILETLANISSTLVSIVFGLAWSIGIIALAWLRYRPTAAVCMIVLTLLLLISLFLKGRADQNNPISSQ